MKELEYPFDGKFIIGKKLKLRKQLNNDDSKRIQKKIAILGGSTTNDIKLCIELFLLNYGIEPEFYESEYNQYYQDAMFPPEELLSFQPDFIYICTTNRNITRYPVMGDSADTIQQLLDTETAKFKAMWENLTTTFHCPIIQNNFEKPVYRLLGNKDATDIHGRVNFINRLNQRWAEYAQSHENFYVCDLDFISSDFGLSRWHDLQNWYMYKIAMNLEAIPYLAFNVANIIKSLLGKNKKGFPFLGTVINAHAVIVLAETLGWATYLLVINRIYDSLLLSEEKKDQLWKEAENLKNSEEKNIERIYKQMNTADRKKFTEIIEEIKDFSYEKRDYYLDKLTKIIAKYQ